MNQNQNTKQYDLEDRTFGFSKNCRVLIKKLSKNIINFEDGKQLVRSSGSVHANYIGANESLSKKDFGFRVKLCRKEAKESRSWLRLIDIDSETLTKDRDSLVRESEELMKIYY